jgi:hypothetical protein
VTVRSFWGHRHEGIAQALAQRIIVNGWPQAKLRDLLPTPGYAPGAALLGAARGGEHAQ